LEEFKIGVFVFALESTLIKELVIENVRPICWIVPKNIYSFWIKLIYFMLEVALIEFHGRKNYFSIPEENI
jgi:hypothetical protein